ncbi:hypothetical protein TIFTF001_023048 [Ficus carica]|uniref:Uncharacterized protein n=1 Tax=Ficus carica TaxID=3494 RepID=A0AA88DK40_FICCA|nr:hypothetical protein TIFTF001_023048 [Ficus carica]
MTLLPDQILPPHRGSTSPTYYCTTSRRHRPPPALTGATLAGVGGRPPYCPMYRVWDTWYQSIGPIELASLMPTRPPGALDSRPDWVTRALRTARGIGVPTADTTPVSQSLRGVSPFAEGGLPPFQQQQLKFTLASRPPDYSSHGQARQPGYPGPRQSIFNRITEHPATSALEGCLSIAQAHADGDPHREPGGRRVNANQASRPQNPSPTGDRRSDRSNRESLERQQRDGNEEPGRVRSRSRHTQATRSGATEPLVDTRNHLNSNQREAMNVRRNTTSVFDRLGKPGAGSPPAVAQPARGLAIRAGAGRGGRFAFYPGYLDIALLGWVQDAICGILRWHHELRRAPRELLSIHKVGSRIDRLLQTTGGCLRGHIPGFKDQEIRGVPPVRYRVRRSRNTQKVSRALRQSRSASRELLRQHLDTGVPRRCQRQSTRLDARLRQATHLCAPERDHLEACRGRRVRQRARSGSWRAILASRKEAGKKSIRSELTREWKGCGHRCQDRDRSRSENAAGEVPPIHPVGHNH